MMRIIAGRFKGQTVKTISKAFYRPTQSRIRKSLFDILGPIKNKTFLDLYAGSGIMGFEAASRGVEKITFVENQYAAVKLLNDNSRKLNPELFTIIKKNALDFLKYCKEYDIIFADPPYECQKLIELVKLGRDRITPTGTFILESKTGIHFSEYADSRIYGDTQLNLWIR